MTEEFLIDTDILVDYLTESDTEKTTTLEKVMQIGICFTTVINASELYFVTTEKEKEFVDKLLKSLKILGLNSRYSLLISNYSTKLASVRDALFCAVAEKNNLPILTSNTERYGKTEIKLIHPKEL